MNSVEAFGEICVYLMDEYYEKMHEFLKAQTPETLTDGDLAVMIMNITTSMASNLYISLNQFLPNTKLDYDYMRATIINKLKENFEKIKTEPRATRLNLTPSQIKEIEKKGELTILLEDGSSHTITKRDVFIPKEDADNALDKVKENKKAKLRSDIINLIN